MNIKSRLLLFLFDVFCVIYSYDNIEKNSLFIHYCIILSTIFLSIINILRIECMYSTEEYESWKKKSFTNTHNLFLAIENIGKITFLYHLFPMEQLNLYTFSIIFLQIRTILLLIILVLSILYMIYMRFSLNKSKRIIQPIQETEATQATQTTETTQTTEATDATQATQTQYTKIEFTSLNECSICMEINYNQVIITDCNHEFHEKCLFEWMKNSPTCPICRNQLEGT